jgi:hypothetical protein
MPGSNCFWVTNRNGEWYLGTWLPAVYRLPAKADLGAVCEAIFQSSLKAIWEVDDGLVAKFNLRRLTEGEIEALGT